MGEGIAMSTDAVTTMRCCAAVTPSRKPLEMSSAGFSPLPITPPLTIIADMYSSEGGGVGVGS